MTGRLKEGYANRSEAQIDCRKAARRVSGANQNHEPMNKNPIEGRSGLVSWHNTAKPFVSAREVNGVVVWWRTAFLPGEWEQSGHSLPEAARRVSVARQIPSSSDETGGLPTSVGYAERLREFASAGAPWRSPDEGPNR